ncbi:MAG: DNA-binding response regulator [Bacillota bacterium]
MEAVVVGKDKSCYSLIAKSTYKRDCLPLNAVKYIENIKDVVGIIQKENPALLIWDIEGQEEQALVSIRKLKNKMSQIITVIVSKELEIITVRAALRCDVDDYLLKPLTQRELVDSLLGLLFDRLQLSSACDVVGDALSYMQKNCMLPITLDDIAKKCFVSPCYLSRRIKEKTGRTFVQNLRDMRLAQAEWMLLNTNQTIRNIARSSGFSNDSYFTYVFRNEKGVTPTVFRQTRDPVVFIK